MIIKNILFRYKNLRKPINQERFKIEKDTLVLLDNLLMIATICLLWMWFGKLLIKTGSQGPQCAPPREGFSKADLVGTWIAGTPSQRDTLIIKADGTYKQMIHLEFATKPAMDYASDWQKWWLENGDTTVPVLHLEGWRMCGYDPGISCDIPGGSGSHMCQIDYKDIPGEGVLYVMGESELTLTLPLLENSWFYWREP
jgi:hypothetical protein